MCLGALLVGAPTYAQSPPSTQSDASRSGSAAEAAAARVINWPHALTPPVKRFAVLGSVKNPGVYETTAATVRSTSLLSAAGFEPGTSGSMLRYHIGGHPVPIRLWSVQDLEIASGDIYVVMAASETSPDPSSDQPVHVAVVGIHTDPTILKVAAGDRSLEGLLSRLMQPGELADSARVLRNGRELAQPQDLVFHNGDVLILDPVRVNQKALQQSRLIPSTMPMVAREQAAPQGSRPVAPQSNPQSQSERFPWEQVPTLPASNEHPSHEGSIATAETMGRPIKQTALNVPDLTPAEQSATVDNQATRPAPQQPSFATEESSPQAMTVGAVQTAAREPNNDADTLAQPETAFVITSTAPAAPAKANSQSTMKMVLFTVFTLLLGLVVLCLRMLQERPADEETKTETIHAEVVVASTAKPSPRKTPLQMVLDPQVDEVIEEIPEPHPVLKQFQGHAVRPQGVTIHPSHQLAAPHFQRPGQARPQTTAEPAVSSTAALDVSAVSSAPEINPTVEPVMRPNVKTTKNRIDEAVAAASKGPHPERQEGGLLDRVLLSMQRGERS